MYLSGYQISQDLDYYKCLKKLVQNSEYSSEFNRSFVSTGEVKIYFNLKPSININLLPSLNDGRLYSLSFDMLQDTFLRF